MHILKEKKFLNENLTPDEHKLDLLRKNLLNEPDIKKKLDIGKEISQTKRNLVAAGIYKYYTGDKVTIFDL